MDHREESLRQSPPSTTGADADASAQTGEDVFNIIAEVEKQLSRMRASQQEQHQQVTSLSERSHALSKSEQEIARRAASLKELEQQFQQQQRQHEQKAAELQRQSQQIEHERSAAAKTIAEATRLRTEEENRRKDVEAQLARQAEALSKREAQFAQTQADLKSQQGGLESARRQIEEQAAELQKQTGQFNEERQRLLQRLEQSDARSRELAGSRKEIEQAAKQFQAAESKLQAAHSELESARGQRDELSKANKAAQGELKDLRHRLDEAVDSLKHRESELARIEQGSQTRINDLSAKLSAAREALSQHEAESAKAEQATQAQIKELSAKASAAADGLKRRESELAKAERAAEAKISDLESRLARATGALEERDEKLAKAEQTAETRLKDLNVKLNSAVYAVAQREAELAEAKQATRSQSQDLNGRLEKANAALSKRETELNEARSKLATAGKKLTEFAGVLSEQSPQLERGYAAMAEVQQLRRQIEQLEQQTATHNLDVNPEEVKRKDERIEELTEALRQSRGQRPGDPIVPELEQRIAALNDELKESHFQAEHAKVEAHRLAREVEELRQHSSGTSEAAQTTIRELEQRLVTLQAQLAAAEVQGGAQNEAKMSAQMRSKMQRLKEAAMHLQRRKARLEAIRKRLRQTERHQTNEEIRSAAHDDYEDRARQIAQIHQQRSQLHQLHGQLVVAEEEMIRKWARPRAMSTLVWLTAFMLIMAVGSWLATNEFFPAKVSASVVLEAEPRPGKVVSPEEATKWQEWHTDLLKDSAFQAAVAKRAESRHLDQYRDAAAVTAKFSHDLRTDSTRDGQLVLTLTGNDRAELCWLLDTIASTLSAESARQFTKRGEGSRAAVLGERKEDGQVRYARINPVPIADDRLVYAGIIFGISCVAGFMMIFVIYGRLVKAKRIFEAETAVAPITEDREDSGLPMR